MKKAFILPILLLSASPWLATACKKPETPSAQAPIAETKFYKGHGQIVAFQAEGRVIVLKHDKIEGFMEGMTMGFELMDPTDAKSFKIGEIVDFDLQVSGDNPLITRVVRAAK